MKKHLKTLLFTILALSMTVVLMIVAINIHIVSYSGKYIVDSVEKIAEVVPVPVQTVVVLGARVYPDGRPCAMLQDRLDAGISIYENDLSLKLLLTGDHGTIGYDEVNSMKEYTLGQGIPKEDVFLDHAGFSTYDSMVRAARIFKVESAVVSTQEFHLYRAIYIARRNGIEAWGIKADLRKYPQSEILRYTVREWLARTKDFFYVNILRKDPVYLGEAIPITGDSSPSYD